MLVKTVESVQRQTLPQQVTPLSSRVDLRSNITDRLFLLFHGATGTGKSLAAQCLADYARHPLFIVTSGTKTHEATFIDCLRTVFKLAKHWGCMVLMDHVDTVMETRGKENVERNTTVTGRL